MQAPRVSMRKRKEGLRLSWTGGLSRRPISRTMGSASVRSERTPHALTRRARTGLASNRLPATSANSAWRCQRRRPPTRRIAPNYAARHRDLRRRG